MSKFWNFKKELLSNKNCPKISNEDATLHIEINDSSEVLSNFTEDSKPIINSEFANFLHNSVKDISVKDNITIEIVSKNKEKSDNITSAIKNYYYNEFIESERKLKINLIFSLITFLVGTFALALTMVNSFTIPKVVNGVIDIFAWVFLWEAVDLFFFRRHELRYEQYRQMNFINAKIIIK